MSCELAMVALVVLVGLVVGMSCAVLVIWDWERVERARREEPEARANPLQRKERV